MGNKLLERIQSLADAAAEKGVKPGDAMQYAQAALSIAKAVEALVGSGCKLRDPDISAKGNGDERTLTVEALEKLLKAAKNSPTQSVALVATAGVAQERPYALRDLLEERNAIERLALEWGDRWLAESPALSFAGVYPITFDRAKAAERLYGCGEGNDSGLTMNECRAKVGLGPI